MHEKLKPYYPTMGIMEDVIKNRYSFTENYTDEQKEEMTEDLLTNNSCSELFRSYMTWHGIIGYENMIATALKEFIVFDIASKLREESVNLDNIPELNIDDSLEEIIFNLCKRIDEQTDKINDLKRDMK